jgi:hypothetical protein
MMQPEITDVIGIATVPSGEIGKSINRSQMLALKTMRNIPEQIRRAVSARSSLGDMTDQILVRGGNFAGIKVHGILPERSLGALTNINHDHLHRIEKLGYDDATLSCKELVF